MTDLNQEYAEFLASEASTAKVSKARHIIMTELNPTWLHTVTTFSVLTVLTSFLTLLVCPQFGLGGVLFGHEILHLGMFAGEVGCAAMCASIFFGCSILVSHIALPTVYRRKIAKYKISIAVLMPAALMLVTMASAAVLGEFVFMGAVFTVSWYVISAGMHLGAGFVWGRHATA